MCKSVLHKHATQEFIVLCLTRELGIIIKISFTEKKNIQKKLQYKTFKVIIFTLLGVFGRVRMCVFSFSECGCLLSSEVGLSVPSERTEGYLPVQISMRGVPSAWQDLRESAAGEASPEQAAMGQRRRSPSQSQARSHQHSPAFLSLSECCSSEFFKLQQGKSD